MQHISIVATGSRGDVQPYVALGQGLKDAGYHVRLISSDDFEGLVTEAGLEFYGIGESVESIMQRPEWRNALENGNFLAILKQMRRTMSDFAEQIAAETPALLRDSELIIAGMGGLGGPFSIAEHYQIPVIQAYVGPFYPTSMFASPLVPRSSVGRPLNRASFHLTRQMIWHSSRIVDTRIRKTLGMRRGSFWGPFQWLEQQVTPLLYGYSSHVLPRPTDWDDRHYVTGYWFLDEAEVWTPPADLVAFLKAGPPPVYIGFGSMAGRNPEEAGQIALEALQRSGQRGILAAGWGGLNLDSVPEHVHLIQAIPHSWLFPQLAAVVHHGGAGTTAAGLRAGVPSVLVPFMGDQPHWGRRIVELGVGPQPIPRKILTSDKLAQAIQQSVSQASIRERAAELGVHIRNEHGVATAVEIIQQTLRFHGTASVYA